MQYSIHHRRRLRPITGSVTTRGERPAPATGPEPIAVAAEGSGLLRRPRFTDQLPTITEIVPARLRRSDPRR